MPSHHRIAIVAALEREVRPLIRNWKVSEREFGGRKFRFFDNEAAVLVCGGIGEEAARRAAEAVIELYSPALLISAGFAGALEPELHVGHPLMPRWVVDAGDGSRVEAGSGDGILVSFDGVAGTSQKNKLAKAYGAQAVDMEAAAVAKSAEKHGVRFAARKVISDELDFAMPPVARFVNARGEFRTGRFVLYSALRPWLWARVARLSRNSALATNVLCAMLTNVQETVPAHPAQF